MQVSEGSVQVRGALVRVRGALVQVRRALVQVRGALVQVPGALVQVRGPLVQARGALVQGFPVRSNARPEAELLQAASCSESSHEALPRRRFRMCRKLTSFRFCSSQR